MKSAKNNQLGVSLLEVMLVLVIGASILYLSMQQYYSYRRDAEVVRLRSNVDLLFQAMAKYFQANCNCRPSAGTNCSAYPFTMYRTPIPVTLAMLINGGFLNLSNTGGSLPLNALVDSTGPNQGYIMQFNQLQTTTVPPAPLTLNLPYREAVMSAGGTKPTGYNMVWQIQISVLLLQPSTAKQYQNLLNADCLSESTGQIVTPCLTAPANPTAPFLVFQGLPSSPNSAAARSTYWQTMPTVKLFRQMYEVDPILVLTNGNQTTSQYYVCGS